MIGTSVAAALVAALAYRGRRRALALLLGLDAPKSGWRARWFRVPGAEGHALATQVLSPTERGPHPTLLIRTPYGQGFAGGIPGVVNQLYATLLAERGYHVVQQDVRGRFTSEGTFLPFQFERRDGLATLRWLERQPWFDGRLGLFGQSYGGFVQWAIADDPAVKALVPIQTSAELAAVMHADGAVTLEVALRFLSMMKLFGVEGAPHPLVGSWRMLRQTAIVRPACAALPICEADVALQGEADPYFREAITLCDLEALVWQELSHAPRRDGASSPSFFLSGWLDPFLRETLRDFCARADAGHPALLTVGPWPHGAVSGVWIREVFRWLDHVLKGAPAPERHPVRYQLLHGGAAGRGEWRESTTWPPPGVVTREVFLGSAGALTDRPPTEGTASPTTYTFDPRDPTPHLGGPLLDLEGAGYLDNAPLEARPDVRVFTGAPLDAQLDVVGAPVARVFVRSSEAHTDFFVRLSDVDRRGRSTNVTDGFVRVAPGRSLSPLVVEMWPTAYRFRPGHRLRVLVASGAHPRYARNHGTGEPQATAVEMREQHQEVFHDGDRPSSIVLSVAPAP